ncbi:DinB family protein [Saccharothrix sp. Mg75]|uniref:DinB family protein n=1 Tax=Saccharothrix sp. Mg75 TaxID=3445357 RepID=UPI003EEC3606
MPLTGLAVDLHRYLQEARDNLLRSLDGLDEYDIRRPVTPTGTNLLGLVKHVTGVEAGYLCESVGRPAPVRLPWVEDDSVWDNADMWATADQSREYIIGLYEEVRRHSDRSLAELPLDAPAEVAWWSEEKRRTTFGSLLVRVVAETAQHAGHADIVREVIDGGAGKDRADVGDAEWWTTYVAKVQHAADAHRTDRPQDRHRSAGPGRWPTT